jgi:predicted DNA-binding transcriptional regulator AlpA
MNLFEDFKDKSNFYLTITCSELLTFVQEVVTQTVNHTLANKESKVFSREDVMKRFGISETTLWRWENEYHYIKSKRIGNRIYFSEDDVNKLIEKKNL